MRYSWPTGKSKWNGRSAHGNTCITVRYIPIHTIKPLYLHGRCHLLIVALGVIGCSSPSSSNCPSVTSGSIDNPPAFTPCAAPLASTAFSVLSKAPDLSPEEDCKLLFGIASDFSNFFSPCFLARSDMAFRRASMYVSYLNISLWI